MQVIEMNNLFKQYWDSAGNLIGDGSNAKNSLSLDDYFYLDSMNPGRAVFDGCWGAPSTYSKYQDAMNRAYQLPTQNGINWGGILASILQNSGRTR